MQDPTHNHIAEKIEFDPPRSNHELLFNAIIAFAKNKNSEFSQKEFSQEIVRQYLKTLPKEQKDNKGQ